MSVSLCPKCGQSSFKMLAITPVGSQEVIRTIICQACSAVVGTIGDKLEIEDKLGVINKNLGQIMEGMKILNERIKEIRNNNNSDN